MILGSDSHSGGGSWNAIPMVLYKGKDPACPFLSHKSLILRYPQVTRIRTN